MDLDQLTYLAVHSLHLDRPSAPLLEILLAIALSVALQFVVAFVYKRTFRGADYAQDFVHMLIILGTVVTLVIQAVHGDKATAFGMFAIFSIFRFGHSLRQSRDIGFVFLAMGTGLGIGTRYYLLSSATTLVLCAGIYFFSKSDMFSAQRLSHALRILVTNEMNYDTIFDDCFSEHLSEWDLRSVKSVSAGMMTELRLQVSLKNDARAGAFVSNIRQINGNHRVLLTTAAPDELSSE